MERFSFKLASYLDESVMAYQTERRRGKLIVPTTTSFQIHCCHITGKPQHDGVEQVWLYL